MSSCKSLLCVCLTVALLSCLSFAATRDRITGAIDATNAVPLQGHVTPLARPQYDQGPADPSRALHVTMLFAPTAAQEAALTRLLAEQQDRKSPNYHKWLTPEQYGERFGLSSGDLQKVRAWLTGQGFKVTYVARGRGFISFDGSAGLVASVFRTSIHEFNVNGKMHFANIAPPMIPAALQGIVSGFRGMHDFFPHSMMKKHADYTTGVANPPHVLAPGDLATIYDISPLYPANDGTGQNIAIMGQSDVYLDDLHYYRTDFGISDITGCNMDGTGLLHNGACTSGNFQVVYPPAGDPGAVGGDLGESNLDIDVVSAVAHGAQIIFVTSAGGVDDSATFAIDQNLAPVISYSYGLCEAFVTAPSIAANEPIYQQGASQGISFFAASGDAAAATCDGDVGNYPAQLGLSVSYPASSQYVTGVGGTEFNEGSGNFWNAANGADGGSAKSYIPEIAWNDTTLSASLGFGLDGTGGGPSNCAFGSGTTNEGGFLFEVCDAPPNGGFPKPSWQSGITPADSVRDVPDISFSASNANDVYVVCVPQTEVGGNQTISTCTNGIQTAITTWGSLVGGTSASTPLAAAMTGLLNEFTSSNGLGSINQQLYNVYSLNPPPNGPFHDIVAGANANTEGTSDNIVTCTAGTPAITGFPSQLQCPAGGTFGFSAISGYDTVTGLGSLDIDAFFNAWVASEIQFTTSATALSPASVSAGNSTTSTITINPGNTAAQNATYSLSCSSGLPSGAQCTFNPTTVNSGNSFTSTLTISTAPNMAAGTSNVIVSGTSGGVSQPISSPLSLQVTATTESFNLTASIQSGSTVNVAQGASAPVTLTVNSTSTPPFITSNGGNPQTNLPVTYTCAGMPSESTCMFSPSGTTSAVSVTVTMQTTAPTASLRPIGRSNGIFYAFLLPGLLGIVLTFGSRKGSFAGIRMLGLIMVLGCSTLWLGSCGGSSNGSTKNPGTPVGQSTITVNATTGGANPITSSFSFVLNVTAVAK